MSSCMNRLHEQSQVIEELRRQSDDLFTKWKAQCVNPEENESETRLKEKYKQKVAELQAAIQVSNALLYDRSREINAVVQLNDSVSNELFAIRTVTSITDRIRSCYRQPDERTSSIVTKRAVDKKNE